MLEVAVPKSQLHGMDMPSPGKCSAKSAVKTGSLSVPKLDLSLVAHGERIRLHPNSVRMLLSDDLAPQEKDIIKGPGSWSRVLEPLLTKHVSDALVNDVTKICATVNLIPGQFLLRQGLQSKSIFIVVSGTFRLISLGAPGIEPMDSSRAKSARRSFAARQEAQTFGALIDPPESNKPSPSFASQVPCFRVATVGPGQLLGEDCFSALRIIQFSVMSESYATVLSIPIDSLLPMLSNERYLALSTMCLNTLAHRSQRGVAGGSWYLSKRTELQGLKHTDQSIAMIGTSLQTAIKTAKPDEMHNVEDSSILNSVAPAYPIATSTEGQKIVQEQLMVCVVSASVKSSRFPKVSATSYGRRAISVGQAESGVLRDVEFASSAAHPDTNNPSAPDTTKHSESFSRPWASHRSHTARCSNNLEMGQLVHPSQSQSGHSADMLLSRNLIIKKMHHQLQQAEKSKQIRLQPTKQGDQLSLKNALNMFGREANVVTNGNIAQMPTESRMQMPKKFSIVDAHVQKLFVNVQPTAEIELVSESKKTFLPSGDFSAAGRAAQSQESARSRPYNSNFSYLFETKESDSPHHDSITQHNAIQEQAYDHSFCWTSNPCSQPLDQQPSNSTANLSKVQVPHPPVSQVIEHSSATVTAKRRMYAVISSADFSPAADADLTIRGLTSRPQHKTATRGLFQKHAGKDSPRTFQPSSVTLSNAKTEPKGILTDLDAAKDTDLFIGSKISKQTLSSPAIKNSSRVKGVHSVLFQMDQVGPSLDRDLEYDELLSFSMTTQ